MMDFLTTVPYYTAYLSRALLASGIHVTIGAITYYLDRDCFTVRGLRLQPGPLNVVGGLNLSPAPRRILKIAELAVNLAWQALRFAFRPAAIVHVQFLPLLRWPVPLDLWFVRFCQWRGSKIVLTVHDLLPHDTAEQHHILFEKLYRTVDTLICHSEHIHTRLISEFGIAADKVAVIPHGPFFYDSPNTGADRASANGCVPNGAPMVLWQGIIFPYKGLDLLLDAWQTVEQRHPTAWLVVVGTGDPQLLTELRTRVGRLGLDRVTLDLRFATTEELVAAYDRADVVVYPYRAITTSGALATGLALGKAIVASDLPVFRELLTDGENAFLVTPGDTASLAEALLKLVGDDALRSLFSARVNAMNFGDETWRSIARSTLAVYRSALERTETARLPTTFEARR